MKIIECKKFTIELNGYNNGDVSINADDKPIGMLKEIKFSSNLDDYYDLHMVRYIDRECIEEEPVAIKFI